MTQVTWLKQHDSSSMSHVPSSHVAWKSALVLILSWPKNVNCLSVLKKMILRSRYIFKIRDLRTQIVLYIKIFRLVLSGSKIFIEDIVHIHKIRSILWMLNRIMVQRIKLKSAKKFKIGSNFSDVIGIKIESNQWTTWLITRCKPLVWLTVFTCIVHLRFLNWCSVKIQRM